MSRITADNNQINDIDILITHITVCFLKIFVNDSFAVARSIEIITR